MQIPKQKITTEYYTDECEGDDIYEI